MTTKVLNTRTTGETHLGHTETVTADQLAPGDVILALGKTTFPFPFQLSQVNTVGAFGVQLIATHGWFTPGPVRFAETVVREVSA